MSAKSILSETIAKILMWKELGSVETELKPYSAFTFPKSSQVFFTHRPSLKNLYLNNCANFYFRFGVILERM